MKYKYFKIFLTLAFFYYLYNVLLDKNVFDKLILSVRLIDLLPIFFLSLVSIFFLFNRFNYLAKNILGIKKKLKIINIFLKSLLISQIPIPILAEGFRAIELKEISNQREKSIYIVLIERISGLISNIILLVIFLNLFVYSFFYNYFYAALFGLLIFFIIFFKIRNIILLKISYINYIYLYIRSIKNISKILLFAFIYSFVGQLISLLTVIYTLSLFYNFKIILSVLLFIQLSNLVISLPIFVNGLGAREALYGIIFHAFLNIDYSFSIFSASIINIVNIINSLLLFFLFNLFDKKNLFFLLKVK